MTITREELVNGGVRYHVPTVPRLSRLLEVVVYGALLGGLAALMPFPESEGVWLKLVMCMVAAGYLLALHLPSVFAVRTLAITPDGQIIFHRWPRPVTVTREDIRRVTRRNSRLLILTRRGPLLLPGDLAGLDEIAAQLRPPEMGANSQG